MRDTRIVKYREAAVAMKEGQFRVDIPREGEDDVAALGSALAELSTTLEAKFEEVNTLSKEVNTLSKITEKINAGLVLDEVLNYVFESFWPIIPYDRIGFSLLEQNGTVVRARWARSDAPLMKIERGYSAPLEGSSLQRIMETGRPRILNDLREYLAEHPASESTRLIVEEGMRSSLTCPLIAAGKPMGFMFFSSMEPHTFKDAHVEIFLQIAGQLSLIVEKARLYEELHQLKNKFLGMAAHDLRSPLTVMKGYLDLFLGGNLEAITDSQRAVMQRMFEASVTMLAFINELLNGNAIEAGCLELKLQKVDLAAFLRKCQESNSPLGKARSVSLDLDHESNLPEVKMDAHRVSQVLNNMITNAINYSNPNSRIRIHAQRAGQEVEISVSDQGQGIPEGELHKLFTDFGRTSARPTAGEKGAGLGLAIVKRMVEIHGGRVWAESKVGAGSKFTFTLPIEGPPPTT
jgi:signal transduction histidine kinase